MQWNALIATVLTPPIDKSENNADGEGDDRLNKSAHRGAGDPFNFASVNREPGSQCACSVTFVVEEGNLLPDEGFECHETDAFCQTLARNGKARSLKEICQKSAASLLNVISLSRC